VQTQEKKKERMEMKEKQKKKRKKGSIYDLGTRIFVRLLHKFKVNSVIIMYKNS